MTPAEIHAAVLAALDAAEQMEQAAGDAPWEWRTDQHGGDGLWNGEGLPVTSVWWDGDRAGLAVDSDDQALIAALRNTAPAVYAGVRYFVTEHEPVDEGVHGFGCYGCDLDRFPCPNYRAAARMIPNLPPEVADALRT